MRGPIGLVVVVAFVALAASAASDPGDQIRELFESDFVERWRSKDAQGLAELWTEDGEWMGLLGSRRVVTGREAIVGVWEIGLRGRDTPESLAITAEVQHVRLLGEGLAQADVLLTFGTEATGLMREAMFTNLAMTAEGWRIVSARVARLPES